MEKHEITVKLKALNNTIAKWVKDPNALFFDPQIVSPLFHQYALLRDALRSGYPSFFSDLSIRGDPGTYGTTDFEGRGHIKRMYLELLLMDIEYCLEILSNMTPIDIPSMKVTREGVFFAGQYFDALQRIKEILSKAQQKIVIIDGYLNEDVLGLLTSKEPAVEVNILTTSVIPALKITATNFNKQYGKLSIRTSNAFHDRFVIIDDRDFYHFGASIKDLGHRGFMFSCIEEPEVIDALRTKLAQEWTKAKVVL